MLSQADLYARMMLTPPDIHCDFSRLARWLTGTSVGLVLGGGGARGAAHVGMVKAIQVCFASSTTSLV
jgi:lysophospholipid hydrolase